MAPRSMSRRWEQAYRFSPDGRWLAYLSDESGTPQVYVRPFPHPDDRVQISTNYGIEPVWSRDGRHVYYRDGDRLMVATLTFTPKLDVMARTPLFADDFAMSWDVASYDVTREGEILTARRPRESDGIVVIRNWHHEIRPRLREHR